MPTFYNEAGTEVATLSAGDYGYVVFSEDVEGIYIDNQSSSDLKIQWDVAAYAKAAQAQSRVPAGVCDNFKVLTRTFAFYVSGGTAVRFTPSASGAQDETVIIDGWKPE